MDSLEKAFRDTLLYSVTFFVITSSSIMLGLDVYLNLIVANGLSLTTLPWAVPLVALILFLAALPLCLFYSLFKSKGLRYNLNKYPALARIGAYHLYLALCCATLMSATHAFHWELPQAAKITITLCGGGACLVALYTFLTVSTIQRPVRKKAGH